MDEQKAPKTKKKKNLFLRLLAFIVTLALVAGAVFVVANYDRLNLDALKRYFTYRSLERNDSGQAASFPYSNSSTDIFTAWGNDLLVCSTGGVRLYSGGGVCYVEDTVTLENPTAEVCGDTAAIYSLGGDTVYLYRDRARLDTLTLENSTIISARLNQKGWLAVTTKESGYKAVITIYDDELEKRVSFRLSSAFVSDAVVTENCKLVAVVSLGQNSTAFESTLSIYDLPSSQNSGVDYDLTPSAAYSLGNNMILSTHGGENIWCVGDYGVSVLNGDRLGTWSFPDRYLKHFSVCDDFTAMLIGKYRLSSQTELYTIDAAGTPSVARVINEQVLSISAAGKYVAVLTANRLDIYDQALDLYSTLEGTDGAKEVLMREDGTALLIAGETAHLYVPN